MKKSKLREYIEALVTAVLIAFVIRSFIIEPFKIPSSSMVPTLLVGDHIFVNKFIYGLRPPFTKKHFFQFKTPKRGEVIVFIYPEDEINPYSLFQFIDYGLTVRGTIGAELPCFGVPVLTAGTGRYSGLGFTNDSSAKEEYLTKLSHIENIPKLSAAEIKLAQLHFYLFLKARPLVFTSFSEVWRGMEQDIEIKISQQVKDILAEKGFDPNLGARPLKRVIQKLVLDPLALRIVTGQIRANDRVVIDAEDKKIIFRMSSDLKVNV